MDNIDRLFELTEAIRLHEIELHQLLKISKAETDHMAGRLALAEGDYKRLHDHHTPRSIADGDEPSMGTWVLAFYTGQWRSAYMCLAAPDFDHWLPLPDAPSELERLRSENAELRKQLS
jgi:hypothetical protein